MRICKTVFALSSMILLGACSQNIPDDNTSLKFKGENVLISCFRGPWQDVIWDRPNETFLFSLQKLGYDSNEAVTFGESICRDELGVGNPDHLRSTTKALLAATPPR